MGKNTASLTIGRLLEVRAEAGYQTVEDVEAIFAEIRRELGKLPANAPEHVTVVDWRRCPVMTPKAAEHMLKGIQSTNPTTVRSAALARADCPTAVMQFVRLFREAQLPNRRIFLDREEMYTWLSEELTLVEKKRLDRFLGD